VAPGPAASRPIHKSLLVQPSRLGKKQPSIRCSAEGGWNGSGSRAAHVAAPKWCSRSLRAGWPFVRRRHRPALCGPVPVRGEGRRAGRPGSRDGPERSSFSSLPNRRSDEGEAAPGARSSRGRHGGRCRTTWETASDSRWTGRAAAGSPDTWTPAARLNARLRGAVDGASAPGGPAFDQLSARHCHQVGSRDPTRPALTGRPSGA
jgi:hypothetical protein